MIVAAVAFSLVGLISHLLRLKQFRADLVILYTIDVAHPPMRPDQVEAALLDALRVVRNSSTLRVLKIVHGHGSTGKGGRTKEDVRNWLFGQRNRFRGVIDGERYDVFDAITQELRREVGTFADADLGKGNPGITLVWVR